MRNQTLFGILSLAMLSSCGKGMQLIKSNQVKGPVPSVYTGRVSLPAGSTDGTLTALSLFDMGDLKARLPFNNVDGKGAATADNIAQIGSAPIKEGYVKNSNLVFRAIQVVTPPANVKDVTAFTLTLEGVKLFAAGANADAALKSQVLCALDQANCAGIQPGTDDKTANADFWKTAKTNPYILSDSSLFKSSLTLGSDAVYEYAGVAAPATSSTATPDTTEAAVKALSAEDSDTSITDPVKDTSTNKIAEDKTAAVIQTTTAQGVQLVIDLKKAFGLADDKAIATWTMDHSTQFNKDGNYRKFRFALGNNLYAAGGKLDYKVDTIGQLPANIGNVVGPTVNGDADINLATTRAAVAVRNVTNADGSSSVKAVLRESVISFEDDQDLTDASDAALKTLAAVIVKDQDSIATIDIASVMDTNKDAVASKAIGDKRSNNIANELKTLGVITVPTPNGAIAKKSKCAANVECPADRMTRIKITTAKGLAADKSAAVIKDLDDSIKSLNGEIDTE